MLAAIKHTASDLWSERYKKEGSIWGNEPSLTAQLLLQQLKPQSKIMEVGFGYGRDLVELAKLGHKVNGIEKSLIGLNKARTQLKRLDGSHRPYLFLGNFTTRLIPEQEYDAVYSHRMLHLLSDEKQITAFTNKAANILKDEGLLYIGARDYNDYNPEQMQKRPDGLYEYKHREGHLISFWNEERFQNVFSHKFDILGFEKGSEIESESNPVPSHFTIMIAKRKPRFQIIE